MAQAKGVVNRMKSNTNEQMRLVERYLSAKEFVIASGFASEIDWQDGLRLEHVSETTFLRETAWVILSSGMRESVVSNCFSRFSSAFFDWKSSHEILKNQTACIRKAMNVFGNARKVAAIVSAATITAANGFSVLKDRLLKEGRNALHSFPFIGPVTSYHLAKNLGMDVVKPDRHLCRMTVAAGYENPHSLCADICMHVGDRLSVVDLVLWRFATLRSDYCSFFDTISLDNVDYNRGHRGRAPLAHRRRHKLQIPQRLA